MAKFRKIGILSSGGDAPGMNAAIRAVARKALDEGIETVGILKGYSGLINGELIDLTPRTVSNIISRGGTIHALPPYYRLNIHDKVCRPHRNAI